MCVFDASRECNSYHKVDLKKRVIFTILVFHCVVGASSISYEDVFTAVAKRIGSYVAWYIDWASASVWWSQTVSMLLQ